MSSFQGHTAFSIFSNEVKFHEQVLIQIQEGDWLDEEQEDESILENNELRRLFRILTLPTPDIREKPLFDLQGQTNQSSPNEPPGQQNNALVRQGTAQSAPGSGSGALEESKGLADVPPGALEDDDFVKQHSEVIPVETQAVEE